jgi:amino acid adenylation domain-containing protein
MLSKAERSAVAERLRRGKDPQPATGIPRRAVGSGPPPASFAQEQLWFVDRFVPGLGLYNIPVLIRIGGRLDTAALSRALDRLAERHEVLRTRLAADSQSRPVQLIDPPRPVPVRREQLTGFEPASRLARLRALIHAESMRPFDLSAGPLLRVTLVALADDDHMLVVVVHHAVFDGWSIGVMHADLVALYRSEVTGEPSGLADLPLQFADYAAWERAAGGGPDGAESYWRRVLSGFETIEFPTDRSRPLLDSFDGALAERISGPALLAGLRELSRQEGTTAFVAILAALLALLHRYTGQDDLIVGTVSANRSRAGLAPLIGMLVNTLPIRCDLSGDPPFTELLGRVKEAVLGAFAHQELPFSRIVEVSGAERDVARAPLFQIGFSYTDRDDTPIQAAGARFSTSDLVVGINAAKFDLAFAAEARPGGLWTECCYKTALFDPGTVARLLGHLHVLLAGAVADPGARLSRLPVLTEDELRAELVEWNDTAADLPVECIHAGFERQAAARPEAVAAEYEGEQVSYRDLNRRANQVARWLAKLGAGPEVPIGVCMGTGLDRLAVLLGVWKAGGCYVPLDPAAPAGRLEFMIADAGLPVVVADKASRNRVPGGTDATVVCLADAEDEARLLPGENLAGTPVTPSDPAYVIYTSGSTGQPKGVLVEHRQAINFLHGMARHWGIGPGSAVLGFAAFTFDVSVMDMFMPLLGGAKVVLAAPETLHSPPRLAELMRRSSVTFACLPPAVLNLLTGEEFPDLRVLLSAGEELSSELLGAWLRDGLEIYNGYGPTEASIGSTFMRLEPSTPLPPPIGRPKPNYQAYVLDTQLNPVPVGVAGELHIGGAGVARGYLNRPELTAERFIPDPFRPGGKLYKTGDLVRRRTDGTLVFAGRIDDQVKIRGLRVELGEIEAALAAHPAVAQAVVTVVTSPAGDKELAGYLRPADGASIDPADIRHHLAQSLPAYMVPAHLMVLDQIPLSPHGKIDKKALPPPQRQTAPAHREPPQAGAETLLAGLYARLLGCGQVGASDSFFDLGGNSLVAMRLVDLIRRETGTDVGVSSVFRNPTPRLLAAVLDAREPADGCIVELGTGTTGQPLFLIHAIGGTVFGYTPLGLELAGVLRVRGLQSPGLADPDALACSLDALVADYTQRIRTAQPKGPYALGGWSMGGVIAVEVARRLERDGAEVSLLVLLDAPFALPDEVPAPPELAARFAADVARGMGLEGAGSPEPSTADPSAQLAWLAQRISDRGTADPDRLDDPGADREATAAHLRQRFAVFAAHSAIMAGYQPAGPRVRARTLLVSADESPNAPARSLWPGQISGPVSVLTVRSDHYGFLRAPLAADVAAAIRAWHRSAGPDPAGHERLP